MPTSAPGSSASHHAARHFIARPRARGFTLLELLVVVSIIAIGSAGVSFAMRDSAGAPLDREAQRLAALLESGRAQSRLSGRPVRWIATDAAFQFEGVPPGTLPTHWLVPSTRVSGRPLLVLGPEPILPPQSVVLTSVDAPDRSVRIATDGLRPFAVTAP